MSEGYLIFLVLTLFIGFIFILVFIYQNKKLKKLKREASLLHSTKEQLTNVVTHLTQEKQTLSAVLTSIYDGVVAMGQDQKVLFYNQRAVSILNLSENDLMARKLFEVVRIPEINTLLERALNEKTIQQKQVKIIGETEKYYEVIVSPLFSKDYRILGIVSVFHDITDLKSIEHMRVDFVANVSHEFKTPLTSIRGYTDTLLQGGLEDSKNRKKFVEIVRHNAERLSFLVDDLLTLSHLESKQVLEKKEIYLSTFVDHLLERMAPVAAKKHLTLKRDIQLQTIMADEQKLEQALINLLDNAIKYTSEGGDILVDAYLKENKAHICVTDTGIGMSAKHLPRIFERFYRVDKGRDREFGGTGLGLAIVKHSALLHGGNVEVESTPGKGSRFSFILPL